MNLDPEKLFLVFVIALMVLGPNRLPQAARSLGKGLAQVRRYTSTFRSEMDQMLAEPRALVQSSIHEVEMMARAEQAKLRADAAGPPVQPGAVEADPPTSGPLPAPAAAGPGPVRDALPAAVPDEPSLN